MRTLDTLEVNAVSGGDYAECVVNNLTLGAWAGGIAGALVYGFVGIPVTTALGALGGTVYGLLTC